MRQQPAITVAASLRAIRERIAAACVRSAREYANVVLIGASKRQPLETLAAAHRAGLCVFGENHVQEAEEKSSRLPTSIDWHLIGPLQSNKARRAVALFAAVHSVDRLKIARKLDREADRAGRRLDVFVQFNLGDEESKSGFAPHEIDACLEILGYQALRVRGLMTIPPPTPTPEGARPWLRQLRELRDRVAQRSEDGGLEFGGALSMGMSSDFEIAIEEGATHVRVGSALFGERPE
ncbi:MAG: YggS family pyridoxal phosphate-dependent enzyme [Acidobacteria bacterium]|nr:MAG: YggS family pyridoxal phosphate-dependent enzyme [Acidobacteriota bacterium]REJ99623.1 MAG: YggS family pyridoxal phosphate-dependent enzyme [Acidobacteriota bacterium]